MLDKLNRINLTNRRVIEKDSFVNALDYNGHESLALSVASELQVLDATSLALKRKFIGENQTASGALTEIRFVNQSLLISSAADGYIRVWDVRAEKPAALTLASTTRPEVSEELKPLLCCDVSLDECTVAAGSEAVKEDAFVLFWDVRNSKKLMGGYWDSHSKDVSQVKFHPENKCLLATGGVDGLVNVFDLEEASEDDAIQYTLNVECAVNYLSWLPQSVKGVDRLGVATTEEEFQLWEAEECEPTKRHSRESLQASGEVELVIDHIVSVSGIGSEAYFVTSANGGSVDIWTVHGSHVTTLGSLTDKQPSSHRDLVKSAAIHAVHERCTMWTAGDDGIVCRWVSDSNPQRNESKLTGDRKAESGPKSKVKGSRSKPY